jgi:Domain of unknown function (DUF4105)
MNHASARRNRVRALIGLVTAAIAIAYVLMIFFVRPSNARDWSPDQAETATGAIDGDEIRIQMVRNSTYRSVDDYDIRWEQRRYNLSKLASVWFIVEPFASWRGPAHTFLSFGFANGDYIAISVEIRKERGEEFSPLKGMLRQFELSYVFGDERDLIGLRANHRKDAVYLYPVRATPEQRRALFLSMLNRANTIAANPEFYNTVTNNCTSSIVKHIEEIVPGSIPFSFKTFLPAFSDDLAYDLGLIETTLPRDVYRAAHLINDLAEAHANSPDFSAGIRSRLTQAPAASSNANH